jgi:hypothetical protein
MAVNLDERSFERVLLCAKSQIINYCMHKQQLTTIQTSRSRAEEVAAVELELPLKCFPRTSFRSRQRRSLVATRRPSDQSKLHWRSAAASGTFAPFLSRDFLQSTGTRERERKKEGSIIAFHGSKQKKS